jgi:hypothetical protein
MTIRIPHRTIALQEKQIIELELQLAQALNEKAVLEEQNKILSRQLETACDIPATHPVNG